MQFSAQKFVQGLCPDTTYRFPHIGRKAAGRTRRQRRSAIDVPFQSLGKRILARGAASAARYACARP